MVNIEKRRIIGELIKSGLTTREIAETIGCKYESVYSFKRKYFPAKKLTLIERFYKDVYPEPNTGCWLWGAGCNSSGYGMMRWRTKDSRTHRLSFELFKGNIPEGLSVCHTCDVRSCVNPDHLFLGTHQDNMDDMKRKGRAKAHIGSSHPMAKLKEEDIIDIRKRNSQGVSCYKIAKIYNVHRSTIQYIISGKLWSHM